MTTCRFGKDYESFFEPGVYLKTYYSDMKLASDDYYTTIMNHWHDIFVNGKFGRFSSPARNAGSVAYYSRTSSGK